MTQLKDANYSIRTTRYRYTEWGAAGSGGAELYDHQSDRAEMHNLANDRGAASQLGRMRDELDRLTAAAGR